MDESIAKICINCGPLTKDKTKLRKDRNILVCKYCCSEQAKKARLNNPEKFREHRAKYKYLNRDTSVSFIKCSKCKTEKGIEDFNKHMLLIRYPYCKICRREATKNHHAKPISKDKHKKWYNEKYEPIARNHRYLNSYGISLEQYNQFSEKQNHTCAICKKPEKIVRQKGKCYLVIDHCHKTKKVRGLLCRLCNKALGMFLESPENLASAIDYLENNK